MPGQGTKQINFGAFPGTTYATTTVTGQTGITASSLVEAWIRPLLTVDHDVMDHIVDPPRVIAAEIVAGVGFTIHGFSNNNVPHFGSYVVAWVWN